MQIDACVLTYNSELFLERCLKSLIKFNNIIAIDSGSTDNTMRILKDYNAKVKTIPQIDANYGFDKARNYALRQTDNDYVFFLDSDEEINPNIYDAFQKHEEYAPWIIWIPRVTMITETRYAKKYHPDYQGRLNRCGYVFWEKPLHEEPNFIGGLDNRHMNSNTLKWIDNHVVLTNNASIKNIRRDSTYTIKQLGYLIDDDRNINQIRTKEERFDKIPNAVKKNIFMQAKDDKKDVIQFLKDLETDEFNE